MFGRYIEFPTLDTATKWNPFDKSLQETQIEASKKDLQESKKVTKVAMDFTAKIEPKTATSKKAANLTVEPEETKTEN